MKAIILSGGFGTTLDKDIRRELEQDPTSSYGAYLGLPKVLVPIQRRVLLDYWIDIIRRQPEIDDTYIMTNGLHLPQFEAWARSSEFPVENIISNGVMENEQRSGAVADIYWVVRERSITDDILVVASDVMFTRSFDLGLILQYFREKKGDVVTCLQVADEMVPKTGILEIDAQERTIGFLEHPSLEMTASRWSCPPFYIYRRKTVTEMLPQFMAEKAPQGRQAWDSPGLLVRWLFPKEPVYAFPVEGRYDTGALEGLKKANALLT